MGHESDNQPPPAYADAAPGAEEQKPPSLDLSPLFSQLRLTSEPGRPNPDSCLAHLKFLFAIETLKEEVGYSDGLWGLWDSRVADHAGSENHKTEKDKISNGVADSSASHEEALSRIREKRWALFVARAVDRYEAWWRLQGDGPPLTEMDRDEEHSHSFSDFPKAGIAKFWAEDTLPPLDVLMVLHTHILNPRIFLEDCMRAGLRRLWYHGMPWDLINQRIDSRFNYDTHDAVKAKWVASTHRSWDSLQDTAYHTMRCPACSTAIKIPWTTCGADEASKATRGVDLTGSGYGDGNLDHSCYNCKLKITKDTLSLAKFIRDSETLLAADLPMPGTILEYQSGMPTLYNARTVTWDPMTFPNRMIKFVLRSQITGIFQSDGKKDYKMDIVKDLIERTLRNHEALGVIALGPESPRIRSRRAVNRTSRVAVRKMLSRYHENFSPFGLELGSAVMRQGIFVQKMYKLDWLHSPTARETMLRLCKKYERFVDIMARHPREVAVPTLDVDLAWHTHQLAPSSYYEFTVAKAKNFIDHDDKIPDNKLDEGFEWTSKIYQEEYGEIYSECTCWYCETIRSSHISPVGKVMGLSRNEKVADGFHTSGAASLCPPDNSAHISSHNAARLQEPDEVQGSVLRKLQDRQQRRLDESYRKACKRAEKKGRKLPPRDQYYDHWGANYYMYGPWMYPVYFAPGMYVGTTGTIVPASAACAAGSCGGSTGGCSAGGGCGSGGPGCANGGGNGGCAGGGGGCGGGGGGGCGGGGGN